MQITTAEAGAQSESESSPMPTSTRMQAIAAAAALAAATACAGCSGTMPAPVGLTAAAGSSITYNATAPFAVGLVPERPPPVRLGDTLAFALSASVDGHGHLYLVSASGAVVALAENLPVQANAQTVFPPVAGEITLRARPPAGIERVFLLVTRQPFEGFSGGAAVIGPVQLAAPAADFLARLNAATAALPPGDWAVTETRVEITAVD